MPYKIFFVFISAVAFLPGYVFAGNDYYGETPEFFYGGGIGFGTGDVEYVELSPMIGLRFSPQFSAGANFTYRWRSDKRYGEDLETEDYGVTLFSRIHLSSEVYLQVEYEYLNYEFYTFPSMETERSDFSSILAGGGFSQPLGGNTYAYATVLYNVDYDEDESPYDEPWVYRVGVSVGF